MIPINAHDLKQVLSRLIELFSAENALLCEVIPSQGLMSYHSEKSDLLNYLEWNRSAIIGYLQARLENRGKSQNEGGALPGMVMLEVPSPSAPTADKNVEDSEARDSKVGEVDLEMHNDITLLLREVYHKAEENMKLIEQKKYLNDKFVELVKESVANSGNDTNRYGPKGKKSPVSVYGKQALHIVYNEHS